MLILLQQYYELALQIERWYMLSQGQYVHLGFAPSIALLQEQHRSSAQLDYDARSYASA